MSALPPIADARRARSRSPLCAMSGHLTEDLASLIKFNTRPVRQTKAPRVSSQGFQRKLEQQIVYQSVLNTLAAPTLVVLHFPVQAFHAG